MFRATLIGLLAVGLSSVASGQEQRWYQLAQPLFFHYTTDDGLPAGPVADIVQDERGFVWLASSDGLIRWDGHTARPVRAGTVDVDQDLRAIEPGPGGELWLGTGKGMVRFDPVRESFRHVTHEGTFAVLDLERGGDAGVAWVAAEEGVFRLDAETGTSRQWLADRDARVFDVLIDDGTVWAGTEAGLYRKELGSDAFEPFRLGADIPLDTRIASLIRDAAGTIWVGTARGGVFLINAEGGVSPLEVADLAGEWVYAMVEAKPGVVWLGTFGGGIVEVIRATGQTRRFRNNRLVPYSLNQDEIYTLNRDRAGRVWVGTRRGLSVHDPRRRALQAVFGDTGENSVVRDQGVRSVYEDSEGIVWLGLGESGVDGIDPVQGRVATIAANPDRPATALPAGAVETIVQLDDRLLIGSNWGVYEHAGDVMRRVDAQGGPRDRYVGALVAGNGVVWAGGTAGLWRLAPGDEGWEASPVEVALTDPRVSELAWTPDGGLVVGTWNGVNWLDPEGSLRHAVPADASTGPIQGSGFVTAIRFDEQGHMWLGTDGGGLYRVAEPGGPASFTRLGQGDGLPSEAVRSLEFDDAGRLWVGTPAGLAVVDPASMSARALSRTDGDIFAPYARNASARTAAGELLFGGDGGLTVIRPEAWNPEPESAPVAIVDLQIANGATDDRVAGLVPDNPVVVPADGNRISIEYAALDYGAGREWRYRYRLDGYEDSWHEAGQAHRTATYTSLPPGDYRFKVQRDDGRGGWADNEALLYVRVLPAWYQTTWARLALVVALLALIALAVRWWNQRLYRRQEELESLVWKRTSELEASSHALREKSRELEEASTTDSLTGLRNRRFLDDNMARDVAQAIRRYRDGAERLNQAPDLLLFLMDFDAFKAINDEYGHAAGDAVLIEMRKRLEHLFRETDYLVRWGGEEFLVVARNVHRDHAEDLAERLRIQVADEPFELGGGHRVKMTCSIGVVPFPFDTDRPDELSWEDCTEIADRCLYAAKRAGRNAWFCASRGDAPITNLSAGHIRREFWTLVEEGVLELSSNREAGRDPHLNP